MKHCINSINSIENCARDLVHKKLNSKYGADYINKIDLKHKSFIETNDIGDVKTNEEKYINRFYRPVDKLSLESIVEILCDVNLYNDIFKNIFDTYYPVKDSMIYDSNSSSGNQMLYNTLNKIISFKNTVNKSNSVSYIKAISVIFYCNEFINILKDYQEIDD